MAEVARRRGRATGQSRDCARGGDPRGGVRSATVGRGDPRGGMPSCAPRSKRPLATRLGSSAPRSSLRELSEAGWQAAFNVQEFQGCSVGEADGQLCLVASRDAGAGDVLLRVPIDETLSEAKFEELFPGAAKDGSLDGLETWMKLVVVLMRFRSDESEGKWRPLLEALDSASFRKHPLLWNKDDLLELQCSQTFEKLKAYNMYLESTWQQIEEFVLPVVGMQGACGRDDFFWAFGALKTNALRPFSQPQALRLVPMLSFLSHSRRPNCNTKFASSGIFKKEETLDLVATSPLRKGDVLLYDFDPQKNEIDVLVDYGTFDLEGPSRGMELTLEIDENDPLYDDKCDVLEEAGLGAPRHSFAVAEGEGDQMIPEDALAFLRLCHLNGMDSFLLESVFRNDVWGFMKEPVSKENESKVCESMIRSCEEALAEFPTTVEQDKEIIGGLAGSRGCRATLAVEARLTEKLSLRGLLACFKTERAQIPFKEYYQERRLKSLDLLDMDGNSTY